MNIHKKYKMIREKRVMNIYISPPDVGLKEAEQVAEA
jgi:hypothetical protein